MMVQPREPTNEDIEQALNIALDDGMRAVLSWWGRVVLEDLLRQQAQAIAQGTVGSGFKLSP